MKGSIITASALGGIAIVAIVVASSLWITQSPISIDGDRYRLGESVFITARGLEAGEMGNVLVYTPKDVVFASRPYDGAREPDFNFYFMPDTTKQKKICTPEDLIGVWRIVFEDSSYPPVRFEVSDEYLPGSEKHLVTVC